MKIVLLRGQVPQDRDSKEIIWDDINQCDDLYTQLAFRLTDERTEVLYWGGNRKFNPIPPFTEKYVKRIAKYKPDFYPDVIIARGGFEEYVPFLRKYPAAIKIYHGAGTRWFPHDDIMYDLVLCDTVKQYDKLTRKGFNAEIWSKPACQLFEDFDPDGVKKEYDICYIANGSQAKIKGIRWVYKTMPVKYRMLHLGNRGPYNAPKKTKRKRVVRSRMPKMISKCKIGILPYASYDSAPRALPEMLACGLPVVALDTVNFNRKLNPNVIIANEYSFWKKVEEVLRGRKNFEPRAQYFKTSSLNRNVDLIRGKIIELKAWERLIPAG